MAPFARAVLLAVAAGAALGFAGQTGSDLHPGLRWVVALGVPWLLTAFFAGAIVGDRLRGAIAGALSLVIGTVAYYALRVALGEGGPLHAADALRGAVIVAGWCAAAIGGGAAFGLAGALWRSGGALATVAGSALVSGALVGEALLLTQEWTGRGAQLVLAAELVAGVTGRPARTAPHVDRADAGPDGRRRGRGRGDRGRRSRRAARRGLERGLASSGWEHQSRSNAA